MIGVTNNLIRFERQLSTIQREIRSHNYNSVGSIQNMSSSNKAWNKLTDEQKVSIRKLWEEEEAILESIRLINEGKDRETLINNIIYK